MLSDPFILFTLHLDFYYSEKSKGHFHFGLWKGHLLLMFLFPVLSYDDEEEKDNVSSFD